MQITEKQAIAILKKHSPTERVFKIILAHSKAVQKKALSIAKKVPKIDLHLIKIGSLLHDTGRTKFTLGEFSIKPGIEGAKILRKEKLPKCARIAERHIGVGIRKQDIKKQALPLPLKDYIPKTREEKIIAHADNLIFGTKPGTLNKVITRFRKELGESYVKRIKKLANEIKSWEK